MSQDDTVLSCKKIQSFIPYNIVAQLLVQHVLYGFYFLNDICFVLKSYSLKMCSGCQVLLCFDPRLFPLCMLVFSLISDQNDMIIAGGYFIQFSVLRNQYFRINSPKTLLFNTNVF